MLELLISSTLAALVLLGSIETMNRFFRIASSAQRTFDQKVAQEHQRPVCKHGEAEIISTCSTGKKEIVQFRTIYKRLDE